jgi:hypothetical protein
MDVIAHGLWGGAPFFTRGRRKFLAAVLIGMAPDLLSFGVFHVTHPGWITLRLAGKISGPPALSILPPYVFYSYSVTHSLLIFTAAYCLLWLARKNPPWLLAPWLLHIVCDIPTHTASYFPTPFLWPFPTPFVDGIPWSTPWFMAVNYTGMIIVYCGMILYLYKKSPG